MLRRNDPPGRARARPLKALALGAAGASLLAGSAGAVMAETTPTIHVVDPNPLNWLWVTWNTMEEPINVGPDGMTQPSLAKSWEWKDDNTLEFHLRHGVKYEDGTKFSAADMKRAWDHMQKLTQPHPPGKWLNQPKDAKMTVKDDYTIDVHYPSAMGTGNALMKFRGMHIPSKKFWSNGGWVPNGSDEAHW